MPPLLHGPLFPRDAPALGPLADLDEAPVHAIALHQFAVRAALGDAAVVHREDLIGSRLRKMLNE